MKKLWLCVLLRGLLLPGSIAGENGPTELPHDLQMQEQLLVLSVKVKKMAEIQDLIVQQQQLLLQHLNSLESQVQRLQSQSTNVLSPAEFSRLSEKLDSLERQVHGLGETNLQNVCAFLHNWLPANNPVAHGSGAELALAAGRLEPYRVQPGDTLLRIIARLNDVREQHHAARVTQGEVEKVNPGLSPDRIRAGQVIWLPGLENP
jgi:hypothetical protein